MMTDNGNRIIPLPILVQFKKAQIKTDVIVDVLLSGLSEEQRLKITKPYSSEIIQIAYQCAHFKYTIFQKYESDFEHIISDIKQE